jgi:hypothetical protein
MCHGRNINGRSVKYILHQLCHVNECIYNNGKILNAIEEKFGDIGA